ncbi:LAMI_0H16248g1_1 [Lachancea mirantina]|uniref:LAMI_0H16248g1_1 n=1 Tax=Lachancea mirantina TaxID=1230905 RepID=A0A1G4KJA1_9SACH|nr:LAMI_0H16248g1_1 [Lachancea mirantina]
MYFSIRNHHEAYEHILRESSSHSSCQLVIFVSCLNVDALCASKILTKLFKRQLVQLQLVPIFGYSELKHYFQELDDNINSVVLVGCGGMVDIEDFLEIDAQEYLLETEPVRKYKRNIYVMDSHRPWNLDNLFGSQIVTCLDDGTVEESLEKQKEAYLDYLRMTEEHLEDTGASSAGDTEDDTQDETEEDDDSENSSSQVKRKRKGMATSASKQRKKLMHRCETLLEEYYAQGTTVSNSIAVQTYSLISSIGETNLQYLWLAILGASSLDIAFPQIYERLRPLLQDEVRRLSPHEKIKTPDTLTVEIQPDYFLFLLRHSSLYDSFFYSNYVNAKLSLWNENGKKTLHKIFARMGISLSTAQENWLYMDNRVKKELGVIFDKNLGRYGLEGIVRDGFVRTFGYRGAVSASECVESITALLEMGQKSDVDKPEALQNSTNATTLQEGLEASQKLAERERKLVRNFWLSWDALDDKMELMQQGLKVAQVLQRSVFNTGVAVLEKKLIKHLRIYRLCILQDGPDLELYRNPLTLLRLGNWIMECCAEAEEKQLLPMVLGCLDATTETYLLAGLPARYPRGLDALSKKRPILNNFSVAFQQIATETGAKVRIDNFESSIIEIRKEDLAPFLEKLTLSGLV